MQVGYQVALNRQVRRFAENAEGNAQGVVELALVIGQLAAQGSMGSRARGSTPLIKKRPRTAAVASETDAEGRLVWLPHTF